MNDLIPCELCSELFVPDEYIIHITTHSPNDNLSSNNRNNHNLKNFGSYSVPSHSNNFSSDTIPCDKCSKQIPLNEYDSHLLLHSLSNTKSNTYNQQIPLNEHFDTLRMIECKYNDCSTKWIPFNEYNDHLTLHRLQSQQKPNTSNDALIALNHQTQIIKQQSGIPDPRRICLSTAFNHLKGCQKPVIPMHDPLTLSVSIDYIGRRLPLVDNHNICGIIQNINHALSNRKHIEYYLCDELLFYYRDREDYSWGCGFRNCQTLCSSLLYKNIYKNVLFNGIGYTPIIEQIQKYLDYAHAQGFDPEGLKELGLTQGRTVWIGAVDVAAILRSFNIPAAIYDFQLSSTPNNQYHHDLFEWVWRYFVDRYSYYKDEMKKDNDRFIAPLYLQHQGHSRTIIGVINNKRSGIRHLLVLDPSVKGGGIRLLNNIKKGNIQSLLRSKKQIKATKYQIVAIPTFGIMTNNDRNRCKTIQSMDVTLINKQTSNTNCY